MDDLISRQAAIEALCNDYCGGHQDCKYYPNCENLRSVQKLPSAQPAEPKRGKWVDDVDPLMLTCGNCGYAVMRYNNTPFCPNCGAKMEVNNEID